MEKSKKLRAIRQTLGQESFLKGDEAVFICPKPTCISHLHKKPKLSVNLVTDRFHCWICSFGGKTLVPLFPKEAPERAEYIESLESWNRKPPPTPKYDQPVLPDEFKTLTKPWPGYVYKSTMSYLNERGIGTDEILKWKLGFCDEGDYRNRVIIPSFDDLGNMNFFVGRAIYKKMLKYKHGLFDKDIIFNDYAIDWKKPITVTEGPFDAMKARDNAIPLQGTILTQDLKLYRKIVLSGVDVFFAMDKDAFMKQLKIMDGLFSFGVTCKYVDLGKKKDVGEMTHQEFEEAKSRAIEIKSSSDLLKMRILS